MNRQQKADQIAQILDHHFPNPKIPLKHKDPFTLLIAVLLSAQCTDVRVNKITPLLFAKAATPKKMSTLGLEEIEAIIRPCGLYRSKAKAIQALSKKLLDEFDGKVPASLQELESLPGVGHKTASVVMCQAFGKSAFPVDTHIKRCAIRWGLSKGKTVEKVEKDLKELFCKSTWGKIHLQIIYFARKYCPARGHRKEECPICSTLSCTSP